MHAELGRFFILLGLGCAGFGASMGFMTGKRYNARGHYGAILAAHAFSLCMLAANAIMIDALLRHDFSVSYVAQVGSRSTPTWVTIVSLWSSLEGSILFWGAILGFYLSAFILCIGERYRQLTLYAVATTLCIGAFFAFVLAGPANPFHTVFPVPQDGPGPNPLLQNHLLMVIHPPTLYLGYVGMTIAFAIAVAALLRGELPQGWLKQLRRWTLIPWLFLTIGIILGGWWAYEVLGWGGYWAWDPVENASLLPWLTATAYLHSTLVHERKKMLKAWTLSLVMVTFLLTILGTFMTRSGVFNSVHSFTQSSIGPIFLGALAVLTLVTFILLTLRTGMLEDQNRVTGLLSREMAFLINNALFVLITLTVLLGTVYPLITEAVSNKRISVGEPYFNTMVLPITLCIVFLMGVGPMLPWGRAKQGSLWSQWFLPLTIGIAVMLVGWWQGLRVDMSLLTFGVSAFAMVATARLAFSAVANHAKRQKQHWGAAILGCLSSQHRRFGGYLVHMAIFIMAIAIAASSSYRHSAEATLKPGQFFQLGSYHLKFDNIQAVQEPNRLRITTNIVVQSPHQTAQLFSPGMNYYHTMREPIGTPAVQRVGQNDLYISLMAFDRDGEQATIKAQIIPLMPWLWAGLPLIILGSLMAIWPQRRSRAWSRWLATSPLNTEDI